MPYVTFNTWSDVDFIKTFTHKVNGTDDPVDLTDSTLVFKARRIAAEKNLAIHLDNIDTGGLGGIVIIDAEAGKFRLTITRQKLASMAPGDYIMSLVRDPGPGSTGVWKSIWHGVIQHKFGAAQ